MRTFFEILWTGGWDSTYRMVELSRQPVTVQPYYIIDPERPTREREIWGMREILKKLRAHPETQAELRDTIFVDRAAISIDSDIAAAFAYCRKRYGLGTQQEWISQFAREHPGIEFCTCSDDRHEIREPDMYNGIVTTVTQCGRVVDSGHCEKNLYTLMRDFCVPLVRVTEREMLENIRRWHYEDVMSLIWFCQRPIRNKPCGCCVPCQNKMLAGMGFLFTRSGRLRYAIANPAVKLLGWKRYYCITHAMAKLHIVDPHFSADTAAKVDLKGENDS